MKKLSVCIAFFAMLKGTLGLAEISPRPLEGVELSRYVGKWYEIAKIKRQYEPPFCSSSVAEYSISKDRENSIDVVNRCYLGFSWLSFAARGSVTLKDPSSNLAAFDLELNLFGQNFTGDYLILELEEDYQWALVGSMDKKSLFVIARTPTLDEETFSLIKELSKVEHGYEEGLLVKSRQTIFN